MGRKPQWRCFHCNQIFTRVEDAAEHFGADIGDQPACVMRDHEHHLIHYIRKLEAELRRHRAEDSDVMRAIYTLECDQARMLREAEEKGYARGVADMKAQGYCADPSAHDLPAKAVAA